MMLLEMWKGPGSKQALWGVDKGLIQSVQQELQMSPAFLFCQLCSLWINTIYDQRCLTTSLSAGYRSTSSGRK